MANTDKNIVITPNNGESLSPIIEFIAASSTVGPQIIKVEAVLDAQDKSAITFTGDNGLILTIADNATEKLEVNSNIGINGDIVLNGTSFSTTVEITDPTADRTITFQDSSGTVAFLADVTGGGDAEFGTITVNDFIIFEGATDDANETTLTVADPTADRTITLPDASGTVAVSVTDTTTTTQGDLNLDFTLSVAGNISATGDAHGLATTDTPTFAGLNIGADSIAEYIADTVGTMVTANTESGITVTYQDADNTLDFDVADFNIELTGDVTGTGTVTNLGNVSFATTIAADSVALGTDTTGDYVASLVAGALIDLQNNTGESATPTIDVDLSELTDMTAAAVGTDELVILDAGVQHRKAINEIPIGLFDTADQIALGTDTTGNYVATIAGTANQVTVSGSGSETAAVTLSLPQNIHTGASPTFAGATLDSVQVGVTATNEIDTASGNLTIDSAGGTVTVDDDLTVTGDLTVSGTTTTINTETVTIADNIIILNSNETGTPSQNSGIEVERGTSTNVILQWNETNDYWEIASGGTTGRILTTGDEGSGNGLDADTLDGQEGTYYLDWTNVTNKPDPVVTVTLTGDVTGTADATLTDLGNGTASIATTIAANSVALGTDTTGNYVQQGATSGNGISGSVNSEGGTFTVTSNATDANTVSTIVFRDASGNFSAGTITADLSGNASTASAWETSRTLELTGDITGSVTGVDGSGNISVATTIAADSVALGTDTTGNYMVNVQGTANEIEVTHTQSEGSTATIGLPNDITISGTFTSADADFTGTTAITLPNGTDAQRPGTPAGGMFRFNTTSSSFEGYNGTAWGTIGGGATVTDETTNATRYISFLDSTSGDVETLYVTSTKLYFNPSTGQLNATEFNSLSDATYKENLAEIDDSLEILKKIKTYSFNWKDNGRSSYGVIAQEIEKILPEIVSENEQGVKSVSYIPLIALLIDAIKRLSDK